MEPSGAGARVGRPRGRPRKRAVGAAPPPPPAAPTPARTPGPASARDGQRLDTARAPGVATATTVRFRLRAGGPGRPGRGVLQPRPASCKGQHLAGQRKRTVTNVASALVEDKTVSEPSKSAPLPKISRVSPTRTVPPPSLVTQLWLATHPPESEMPSDSLRPPEADRRTTSVKPSTRGKPSQVFLRPSKLSKLFKQSKFVQSSTVEPPGSIKQSESVKPSEAVKPSNPIKPVKLGRPLKITKFLEQLKLVEPPDTAAKPCEPVRLSEDDNPIKPSRKPGRPPKRASCAAATPEQQQQQQDQHHEQADGLGQPVKRRRSAAAEQPPPRELRHGAWGPRPSLPAAPMCALPIMCTACLRHGVPRAPHAVCPLAACAGCDACGPASLHAALRRRHGAEALCAVRLTCLPATKPVRRVAPLAAAPRATSLGPSPPPAKDAEAASLPVAAGHHHNDDDVLLAFKQWSTEMARNLKEMLCDGVGKPPLPRGSDEAAAGTKATDWYASRRALLDTSAEAVPGARHSRSTSTTSTSSPSRVLGPVRVRRRRGVHDPRHLLWECVPRCRSSEPARQRRSWGSPGADAEQYVYCVFKTKAEGPHSPPRRVAKRGVRAVERRLLVFDFGRGGAESPPPVCPRCRHHAEAAEDAKDAQAVPKRHPPEWCPRRNCTCEPCLRAPAARRRSKSGAIPRKISLAPSASTTLSVGSSRKISVASQAEAGTVTPPKAGITDLISPRFKASTSPQQISASKAPSVPLLSSRSCPEEELSFKTSAPSSPVPAASKAPSTPSPNRRSLPEVKASPKTSPATASPLPAVQVASEIPPVVSPRSNLSPEVTVASTILSFPARTQSASPARTQSASPARTQSASPNQGAISKDLAALSRSSPLPSVEAASGAPSAVSPRPGPSPNQDDAACNDLAALPPSPCREEDTVCSAPSPRAVASPTKPEAVAVLLASPTKPDAVAVSVAATPTTPKPTAIARAAAPHSPDAARNNASDSTTAPASHARRDAAEPGLAAPSCAQPSRAEPSCAEPTTPPRRAAGLEAAEAAHEDDRNGLTSPSPPRLSAYWLNACNSDTPLASPPTFHEDDLRLVLADCHDSDQEEDANDDDGDDSPAQDDDPPTVKVEADSSGEWDSEFGVPASSACVASGPLHPSDRQAGVNDVHLEGDASPPNDPEPDRSTSDESCEAGSEEDEGDGEPLGYMVTYMCGDDEGAMDVATYECSWCGREFASEPEVEAHAVRHAEPDSEDEEEITVLQEMIIKKEDGIIKEEPAELEAEVETASVASACSAAAVASAPVPASSCQTSDGASDTLPSDATDATLPVGMDPPLMISSVRSLAEPPPPPAQAPVSPKKKAKKLKFVLKKAYTCSVPPTSQPSGSSLKLILKRNFEHVAPASSSSSPTPPAVESAAARTPEKPAPCPPLPSHAAAASARSQASTSAMTSAATSTQCASAPSPTPGTSGANLPLVASPAAVPSPLRDADNRGSGSVQSGVTGCTAGAGSVAVASRAGVQSEAMPLMPTPVGVPPVQRPTIALEAPLAIAVPPATSPSSSASPSLPPVEGPRPAPSEARSQGAMPFVVASIRPVGPAVQPASAVAASPCAPAPTPSGTCSPAVSPLTPASPQPAGPLPLHAPPLTAPPRPLVAVEAAAPPPPGPALPPSPSSVIPPTKTYSRGAARAPAQLCSAPGKMVVAVPISPASDTTIFTSAKAWRILEVRVMPDDEPSPSPEMDADQRRPAEPPQPPAAAPCLYDSPPSAPEASSRQRPNILRVARRRPAGWSVAKDAPQAAVPTAKPGPATATPGAVTPNPDSRPSPVTAKSAAPAAVAVSEPSPVTSKSASLPAVEVPKVVPVTAPLAAGLSKPTVVLKVPTPAAARPPVRTTSWPRPRPRPPGFKAAVTPSPSAARPPRAEFVCAICSMGFASRRLLARHRLTLHINELWHRCHACPFTCLSAQRLAAHVATAHSIARERCLLCTDWFPSTLLLDAHMQIRHAVKPVKGLPCLADACKVVSPTVQSLTAHLVKDHRPGQAAIECNICGHRTKEVIQALSHVAVHLAEVRALHCEQCARWLPSVPLLVGHVVDAHSRGAGDIAEDAEKHECVCGQVFGDAATLLRHAKDTLHAVHAVQPGPDRTTACRICYDEAQATDHWRRADPWHAQEHAEEDAELVPLERVSQLLTLLKDVAVCRDAVPKKAATAT